MNFAALPDVPTERLLSAEAIAERVFNGLVSRKWVLEHCPRVQLSRFKVAYYESQVRAWLATRSTEAA